MKVGDLVKCPTAGEDSHHIFNIPIRRRRRREGPGIFLSSPSALSPPSVPFLVPSSSGMGIG